MNDCTVSLSQMLTLVAGQLDQVSARRMRQQIRTDTFLTKRWRCVRSIWLRLQAGEQLLENLGGESRSSGALLLISRRTVSRDLRRAEAIAAFIEGRLDHANAARIETLCWAKPAWLAEIGTAYYDFCRNEVAEVDTVDVDRLLRRLSDSLPVDSGVVQNRSPDDAVPDESLMIELAKSKMESSPRRPHLAIASWSIAAAVVLLGCLLFARVSQSPLAVVSQPNQANGPEVRQPEVAAKDSKVPHAILDANASESNQPRMAALKAAEEVWEQPENALTPNEPPVTPAELAVVDWNKVLNEAAESAETNTPSRNPEPPQPAAAEAVTLAVPLEWRQTKGIVATRASADGRWQGLNASLPSTQRFEFTTLPASWARADIGEFGSLTLLENAQIRVWRTKEPSRQLHLSVARGQCAMDELPAGATVEIATGQAEWRVRAQSDHTTLAIDCEGESPRLQVVSGEVIVNDELSLKKGDETTWMSKSSLAATRANARPDWIETAPAEIRNATKGVNRKTLDRFAAAEDLVSELRAASFDIENADVQDRSVFARILMKFEPQTFAIEVLESADPGLSRETLTWLFSQDRRQPTIRPIWVALARSTKEPNKIRTLFSWIDMANQRDRVSLETATTMIEWLTDDHLLFRQSGQMFLELAFGSLVEYDPQWPPSRRVASANQWRVAIAEFYRLRQRRDAAIGPNR